MYFSRDNIYNSQRCSKGLVLPENSRLTVFLKAVFPEINPHTKGQLINDKGAKNTQWRKESLFPKCAMKTGQLQEKEHN